MPLTADRVKESSTTTGTGDITLGGAATQFRAFQSAFSIGAFLQYAIVGQSGTEWEVGNGTLTGTTTLRRDVVISSSNSNALVNFSAGTKDVFATIHAEHADNANHGSVLARIKGWAMP